MSNEEKKLYEVLFPNDNNPSYINYGYFTGGNLRKLSLIKSKIKESCMDLILIEDEENEGSFFIRILQKDIDEFMNTIKPFKYKERRIPKKCMSEIQVLFGDS